MDEDTKQEDFITTEFMVTSIIHPILKQIVSGKERNCCNLQAENGKMATG